MCYVLISVARHQAQRLCAYMSMRVVFIGNGPFPIGWYYAKLLLAVFLEVKIILI